MDPDRVNKEDEFPLATNDEELNILYHNILDREVLTEIKMDTHSVTDLFTLRNDPRRSETKLYDDIGYHSSGYAGPLILTGREDYHLDSVNNMLVLCEEHYGEYATGKKRQDAYLVERQYFRIS